LYKSPQKANYWRISTKAALLGARTNIISKKIKYFGSFYKVRSMQGKNKISPSQIEMHAFCLQGQLLLVTHVGSERLPVSLIFCHVIVVAFVVARSLIVMAAPVIWSMQPDHLDRVLASCSQTQSNKQKTPWPLVRE
jgi:hypothetical protein